MHEVNSYNIVGRRPCRWQTVICTPRSQVPNDGNLFVDVGDMLLGIIMPIEIGQRIRFKPFEGERSRYLN